MVWKRVWFGGAEERLWVGTSKIGREVLMKGGKG